MHKTLHLAHYAAERDELLLRIQAHLHSEPCVTAAWLWGSHGRGDADAWSDLDLWIVVADDALAAIRADPQAFVAPIGDPLLVVDAPQNAPHAGAYLLTVYAGRTGPQQVDWYWQAHAAAYAPPDAHLLVARAPLARHDGAPSFPGAPSPQRTAAEELAHNVHFFWAMLLIAAKYIARLPEAPEVLLLDLVQAALGKVDERLGVAHAMHDDQGEVVATPAQKLAVLRGLARQMADRMPMAAAQGAAIPGPEIIVQFERYLALIEEAQR